jgi:hypothetical protein
MCQPVATQADLCYHAQSVERETCQNKHVTCGDTPTGWWQGLHLCQKCVRRYKRHGDGHKRTSWGHLAVEGGQSA